MPRTSEDVLLELAALDELERKNVEMIARVRASLNKELKMIARRKRNQTTDMLGMQCTHCGKGVFKEFDMWGDRLRCSAGCGKEVPRWLKA
jgi:hypothetical protein